MEFYKENFVNTTSTRIDALSVNATMKLQTTCSFLVILPREYGERSQLWLGINESDNIQDLCFNIYQNRSSSAKEIIQFNVVVAALGTIWNEHDKWSSKDTQNSFINTWEDICSLVGVWSHRNKLNKDYNSSNYCY